MSVREAAEVMGLPTGTLKSPLHRARQWLSGDRRDQEPMYIILEYTVCVGIVVVAGTLLYGACAVFVMIQEATRLSAGFIGALMRRRVRVMRSATPLSMHVG